MRAMFAAAVPHLEGGVTLKSRTIGCRVPEGTIATGLGLLQGDYPELDIGSYPFYVDGQPGTNLVLRGPDEAQIDAAARKLHDLIVDLGGTPVEGGIEDRKSTRLNSSH